MPLDLNPPRKWVFYTALLLGFAAIAMHFFGILAASPEAAPFTALYAFWMMAGSWLLLIAAAILKQL